MNTNDIINYVNDIKNQWQTNDPYAIADYLGITVLHTATCIKSFTAQTILLFQLMTLTLNFLRKYYVPMN